MKKFSLERNLNRQTVTNMNTNNKIWTEIGNLTEKLKKLNLTDSIDYTKYYIYSIITHSTAIEGSTLTEAETQLLFDEGIAAPKPLVQNLMNLDLKNAYDFAATQAAKKTVITPEFLKTLSALILKSTGGVMSTVAGTFDTSKGDYRLCSVQAGPGGKSYMNYQKVPDSVTALCAALDEKIDKPVSLEAIYNLSFDAHLKLVTIHPWADGNGRAARLLMNYIQFYRGLVPTKIHQEDRAGYITSLRTSQDSQDNTPFREFMALQHAKTLKEEIAHYTKNQKKAITLMF